MNEGKGASKNELGGKTDKLIGVEREKGKLSYRQERIEEREVGLEGNGLHVIIIW